MQDWWNATTIGDYWRLWNVPVHKWLLRHVYYPALRRHVPKTIAACCVFFVSAVFHELLVGVPLHMVRFWAFSGLMFQVRASLLNFVLCVGSSELALAVELAAYKHKM